MKRLGMFLLGVAMSWALLMVLLFVTVRVINLAWYWE